MFIKENYVVSLSVATERHLTHTHAHTRLFHPGRTTAFFPPFICGNSGQRSSVSLSLSPLLGVRWCLCLWALLGGKGRERASSSQPPACRLLRRNTSPCCCSCRSHTSPRCLTCSRCSPASKLPVLSDPSTRSTPRR